MMEGGKPMMGNQKSIMRKQNAGLTAYARKRGIENGKNI